tara:strand:+ start:1906 stop:4437 length:2532 start_codon:yes stop_codon:yes gene_type:complete
MVDFSKRLSKAKIEKKTNPIEIYDSLDRKSVTGPLRPVQESILKSWFSNHQDSRDIVVKLHTGSGKTLIGLLILQSQLNRSGKPCMFVCPNSYLADQVCLDAKKFGIPFCKIGEDRQIPNNYYDGKKILITHAQKLFNGKSVFGLDKDFTDCGSIILDDSHACIDAIKDAFTIKLTKEHELYDKILSLFEDDLIAQGHGTFLEIKEGEYNSHLHVPYWSFINKEEEVLDLLSKHKDDTNAIKFTWPLIKDSIRNMQLHISGNEIELSPYHIPIDRFGTFHHADQRVLMSATTQDDSFFIKGLSFSKESAINPLEDKTRLWSGEKMLLIPSLISEELDRDLIVTQLAKESTRPFGTVAITPSFKKAKHYHSLGSAVAEPDTIFELVNRLKKGYFKKTVVFANRYDGIDLPDESSRVLIIDSKPFFHSLSDKYEEDCLVESDMINIKLAQKVEQGLGRSVRGEKDFAVIIIIGDDLVKFIRSSKTNKYFSDQTKKQIEIGNEIADMAKDDLKEDDSHYKVISTLLNQAITRRDSNWKSFYAEKMNEIEISTKEYKIYDILEKEREALESIYMDNAERATTIFQDIIDTDCTSEDEKGWYLQHKARALYFNSKSESTRHQKAAFTKNRQLLKPNEGFNYKKIQFIDDNRVQNIKNWINQFDSFDDLMVTLNGLHSDLSFGMPSEKFEAALKEVGICLGFKSERPDKEHKAGPDNLWCGSGNKYVIFECKNEVDDSRKEIKKSEASQMNTHCGWFEEIYKTASVKRILIIPTKQLTSTANFTHEVSIMKKGKLKSLKASMKNFFKEFKNYKMETLTDDKINELLTTHKLQMENFFLDYSEKVYKKVK